MWQLRVSWFEFSSSWKNSYDLKLEWVINYVVYASWLLLTLTLCTLTIKYTTNSDPVQYCKLTRAPESLWGPYVSEWYYI